MINNELDGFELYIPSLRASPGIYGCLGKTGFRLSPEALKILNSDHVLLFLDRKKQRIMLQPAKKDTANALSLNQSGGKVKACLQQKSVVADIWGLAGCPKGSQYVVRGHKCGYATTPSIIFDLKTITKKGKS